MALSPQETVIQQLTKARNTFHAFVNGNPGTYKEQLVGACSMALDEAINVIGLKIDEMEAFKLQRKARIANRAWALFCDLSHHARVIDGGKASQVMQLCVDRATQFEDVEIA